MNSDIARVAATLEAAIDGALAKVRVDVLVMGPQLPTTGQNAHPAATLRAMLLARIGEFGGGVAPELHTLMHARLKFGPDADLCEYEHHLANACHLVVIIPDSPGALCELGYFGMDDAFCAKMIVLVSKEHPDRDSYVSDGPLRAAWKRRAQVHRVEYSDVDGCWQLVKSEIMRVRSSLTLR